MEKVSTGHRAQTGAPAGRGRRSSRSEQLSAARPYLDQFHEDLSLSSVERVGESSRSVRRSSAGRRSRSDEVNSAAPGLVCLATPVNRESPFGARHGMVSELAAWLYNCDWPVQMVSANDPSRNLPGTEESASVVIGRAGQPGLHPASQPQTIGMGYRLKRLSPWLVHAFESKDAVAAHLGGAPYALSLRGVPQVERVSWRPVEHQAFLAALAGASVVTCASRAASNRLLDIYGFESLVLPEGVDTEGLASVPDRRTKPVIVCPLIDSTITDLKVLVDAFVLVAETLGDVQLVIAGPVEKPLLAQLLERIPPELRSHLLVVDIADRKRIVSLLAKASVTCMPSASQCANRALVESLAIGTPVVGADGGAVAELINEDAVAAGAGLRFAAGDERSCASGILQVMQRSGHEEIVDGCRKHAALYDWSRVGPRVLELYGGLAL